VVNAQSLSIESLSLLRKEQWRRCLCLPFLTVVPTCCNNHLLYVFQLFLFHCSHLLYNIGSISISNSIHRRIVEYYHYFFQVINTVNSPSLLGFSQSYLLHADISGISKLKSRHHFHTIHNSIQFRSTASISAHLQGPSNFAAPS
jgi:hypothetical protein